MATSKHDYPISFRAPKSLIDRMDIYADNLCLDRSSLIKMVLKMWLDRMDDLDGKLMSDYPIEMKSPEKKSLYAAETCGSYHSENSCEAQKNKTGTESVQNNSA